MRRVPVSFCRLSHGRDLPPPKTATAGSAGYDLRAALDAPLALAPGARARVPTGLQIALPTGWEGQVRPRSGLAHEHGVTVLNAPGTIDADYRGEIQVLLINHGQRTFVLTRGERVAQLVIAPVAAVAWREQSVLAASERGAGGFGSTGRA